MDGRGAGLTACALALLLWTGGATAQSPAYLTGRVLEAGRRVPIAGATVRLATATLNGKLEVVTSKEGTWRLGPVSAGVHEVEVEHVGYATARRRVSSDSLASIVLTPRPVSLAGLVVTASRREQRLADAVVATEVVDRAAIEATGASDLASVLVEQTGVAFQDGLPVGAGVMLQGLGSERVLVLVDGQPIIGRIAGGLDLSRVAVESVARVEVVKGPQSTLYGSEAMGGVVNVITESPVPGLWTSRARVTGGSRGRLDASGGVTGYAGGVGLVAHAGRRHVELVPGHAGVAGTFVSRLDGLARVEWDARDGRALFATINAVDESQRWRAGTLYHFANNLEWSARAGVRLDLGAHRLEATIYATAFRHLSRAATAPRPVEGTGEREVQRLVEAELAYGTVAGDVAIDGGVELRRESIRSDRVEGQDRALHTVEPFVQATFSLGALDVVPGVRGSWSERWGSHAAPRLALLYRATPRLALRVSLARGYRAPSFKELYLDFLNATAGEGYRVSGNVDLEPETSANVTAGVEWAGDRVYARAQAYGNRFRDFIETRELAPDGGLRQFTYGNIADGRTRGVEVELGATWRAFRAEAGYAYLDAEEGATGEPLLGGPPHSARASLSWTTSLGLRATLTGLHTSRTPAARDEDGATLYRGEFTRFDIRLAHALPAGLEIAAGIDNIADARPGDWPAFTGRLFHIALGWRAERRAN